MYQLPLPQRPIALAAMQCTYHYIKQSHRALVCARDFRAIDELVAHKLRELKFQYQHFFALGHSL